MEARITSPYLKGGGPGRTVFPSGTVRDTVRPPPARVRRYPPYFLSTGRTIVPSKTLTPSSRNGLRPDSPGGTGMDRYGLMAIPPRQRNIRAAVATPGNILRRNTWHRTPVQTPTAGYRGGIRNDSMRRIPPIYARVRAARGWRPIRVEPMVTRPIIIRPVDREVNYSTLRPNGRILLRIDPSISSGSTNPEQSRRTDADPSETLPKSSPEAYLSLRLICLGHEASGSPQAEVSSPEKYWHRRLDQFPGQTRFPLPFLSNFESDRRVKVE